MMEKKYQVFISSTYQDLIEERAIAIETILRLEHIPIGMEMFNAGNDEQWELIKRTIDNSDYYVVIIGFRYGSTTSDGISYTEKEYDYAVQKGLPVLTFIQGRNVAVAASKRESNAKAQKKLEAFVEKAKKRISNFWKNKDELATYISTALQIEMKRKPRVGWVRSYDIDKIDEELKSLYKQNDYLKSKLEIDTNINEHLSDRLSTINEIMECSQKINISSHEFSHSGLPLYVDNDNLFIDDSEAHTLIIGSTGSGKTRRLILPLANIVARSGESMLVADPKGEVYENCKDCLNRLGYKTHVINLRSPDKSDSWNPLGLPYRYYKSGDEDRAVELISDLASNIFISQSHMDPFWENSAADFFIGLVLLLFEDAHEDQINFNSVFALSQSNKLQKYVASKGSQSAAYISLSGTVFAPSATKASIISTFSQKMKIFVTQKSLSYMLSFDSFDISALADYKCAVFIILQDEKSLYYPLVSAFIKQCYESLISKAYSNIMGFLPNRVNFILDEFANITPIKDIGNIISASRSRNIRLFLVVQGISQLEAQYGVNVSQTIKSNCTNWIFLICKELSVLREISELCGYTKDDFGNEKPLISKMQLQRLKLGEMLVLKDRMCPFITKLPDICQYRRWTNVANAVDKNAPIETGTKEINIFSIENIYLGEDSNNMLHKLFSDATDE